MENIRVAIYDIEADGLLDTITRVHCLHIRDVERNLTYRFRQNDVENTIADGVRMLEEAEMCVAHNGFDFDIKVLEKFYDFNPKGKHRDTLVMARVIRADEKERDFKRWKRSTFKKDLPEHKKFPGKLIGRHGLEAWGRRLGVFKGDYAHMKELEANAKGIVEVDEVHKYVWGSWNQEMDDYCVGDLDVTQALWENLLAEDWSEESIHIEHRTHEIMVRQEEYGIPVSREKLMALGDELEKFHGELTDKCVEHFGIWYKPEKRSKVGPRHEYGEDDSRKWWAEVVRPKKALKYKDPTKPDRDPDCPYCPIKKMEFNPNSRPQIVDRLTTIYDWEPKKEEHTEKGNPQVTDEILRDLSHTVKIASSLAEVFYYQKRKSQATSGPNAWLMKLDDNDLIHHRVNCNGAVTGRATHSTPNLAQVPRVVVKKVDGVPTVLKGREGLHGFECRDLFDISSLSTRVVAEPSDWRMVGSDLSGIELRLLGELLAEFDGGAYIDIVLNGDIHTVHQEAAGLDSRDVAKTLIYAMIYGAGDEKLGFIINPMVSAQEQSRIGAEARRKLLTRIPALAKAIKAVQKFAKRHGYLWGLDDRKLFVRSPHAALNTQLQSNGALVSKVWLIIIHDMLEEAGLREGWDGDYVPLLWIHDEVQFAVRLEHVETVKRIMVEAALEAGIYFDLKVPTDAQAKSGFTWAGTH